MEYQSMWHFCHYLICPVFGLCPLCPVFSLLWQRFSAVLASCCPPFCSSYLGPEEAVVFLSQNISFFWLLWATLLSCWPARPLTWMCSSRQTFLSIAVLRLSISGSFSTASLRGSSPSTKLHTSPGFCPWAVWMLFTGLVSVLKAAGKTVFQAHLFESGTFFSIAPTSFTFPVAQSCPTHPDSSWGWLWPVAAVRFWSLSLCAPFLCILGLLGVQVRIVCWDFCGCWVVVFWTFKILAGPSIHLNRIMGRASSAGS